MTVVAVSRWEGRLSEHRDGARSRAVTEEARRTLPAGRELHGRHLRRPDLHGADVSGLGGLRQSHAGLAGDAEYQSRYAEASKVFELQGRALMVAEDL